MYDISRYEDLMRTVRKLSKLSNSMKSFIVSDPSGPMQFGEIYGTDNMITNGLTKFYYKVAKPYTSLVTPIVVPDAVDLITDQGGVVTLTPPSPDRILQQFPEFQWSERLDDLYKDIDVYAKNMAIEKCLAYGDLLMYVTASEARQTMIMVKNLFVTIFEAILQIYKKAKKLNVVATLEVLSNLWLEYRYGWRPFLSEVESLHGALTRIRVDGVKSAYGKSSRDAVSSEPIDLGSVDVATDKAVFTYTGSLTPSKASAKAGFNYLNSDSSRNDDWLAILGLDLEALLTTAWDVIPFSFVVDMFLNIGSILQVQNSSEQVSSFNSWLTRQTESVVELKCTSITLGDTAQKEFDMKEYLNRFHNLSFLDMHSRPATLDQAIHSIKQLSQNVCPDKRPYYPAINQTFEKPFPGFLISSDDFQRLEWDYPVKFHGINIVDNREIIGQLWRRNSSGYCYLYGYTASVGDGRTMNIDYPKIVNSFLKHFDVSEMSDDEVTDFLFFMIGKLPPLEDQFYVDIRTQGNILAELYKNPYLGPFYKVKGFEFVGWGDRKIVELNGGRQYRYVTGTLGSLFFDQPIISETPKQLDYTVNTTVTTRRKVDAFQHELTYDLDLATAQFADLGALAVTLTSRFRN
uniref:Uncharacterized protein n=1 Tax=Wenzhou levi-like virus 5 TaxID=1923571 RepID=A0A1L3KIT0_9VIRU|nr:hypothetical protein [Wenzhou levi-like virus 5]